MQEVSGIMTRDVRHIAPREKLRRAAAAIDAEAGAVELLKEVSDPAQSRHSS